MTHTSTNRGKRILVTGGAGEMAQYACRVLAKADEVELVLVADRDEQKARDFITELGPKAKALALDISDAEALSKALTDVDIVLNCAGPFYRFGREVLSAAIAAGTNYLDICDDWEPTLEMLELSDTARAAGVTAVIGMGASPGTSNLVALLCMNELDEVDNMYTSWRAGALPYGEKGKEHEYEPNAAMIHWIHNCTEPIKVWRHGGLVDAYALDEIEVTYPGLGTETVWVCGHPEPLTLPRVRPEIKHSYNTMTARRGLMEGLQRVARRVQSGELDVIAAGKQLILEPDTGGAAAGPSPTLPHLFAVAEGTKDGKATRVAARPLNIPNANMGEMTGYPLATAALMMCRGSVDNPGVHGPEGAVDPEQYFELLSGLLEDRPEGLAYEIVTEAIVETDATSAVH
jgi:saccharopine dehydrogenase-like NADP-dependent oxidoreductase